MKIEDLTTAQVRWEITDPRSSIFRQAFGYAHHLLRIA